MSAGQAALAVALALAVLMLAACPVSTADAAKIICVWDDNQNKWVCDDEGAVGRVTPASTRAMRDSGGWLTHVAMVHQASRATESTQVSGLVDSRVA